MEGWERTPLPYGMDGQLPYNSISGGKVEERVKRSGGKGGKESGGKGGKESGGKSEKEVEEKEVEEKEGKEVEETMI